jgi:hypothetical protein
VTSTERERIVAGLQLLASFVLLVLAAIPAGDAIRGDASPFVWEALANPHTVRSNADRILAVLMYGAFYALGFVLPYWIITFALFVRRANAAGSASVHHLPLRYRHGRLFACIGSQILFVLFIRPIVFFFRGLPDDNWMLWPWMIGIALGAFFFYAAYHEFRSAPSVETTNLSPPLPNEH